MFDTWSGSSLEDTVQPGVSGAESMSESETTDGEDVQENTASASLEDLDTTLTEESRAEAPVVASAATARPPFVRKQEHVCHPTGYVQEKEERTGPRTKVTKRKHQRLSNQYAKSAFLSDWSDNDDFQ